MHEMLFQSLKLFKFTMMYEDVDYKSEYLVINNISNLFEMITHVFENVNKELFFIYWVFHPNITNYILMIISTLNTIF